MPPDQRFWQACLRVVLAAALCLVGHDSLQAQTTSASVAGSVRDALGGVLPGATVTLTCNLVNMNGIGTVSAVRPPRQLQLVTKFSF